MITLCLLLSVGPSLQAQTETPIKIHGGSTTFFSQTPWVQLGKGRTLTYCTPLSRSDLSQIELQGFYPGGVQSFREKRPQASVIVNPKTDTWHMDIFGHSPAENGTFKPGTQGIRVSVSPKGCSAQTPGPSIHLSPLGRGSFYPPPDLLAASHYVSNKRFFSSCTSVQRDRCERMARIQIIDTDPAKEDDFNCPDGGCVIYIGQPDPSKGKSESSPPVRR